MTHPARRRAYESRAWRNRGAGRRDEDASVKATLQAALSARGYDRLTPVQEAVTAPALEGRDLLVSAQTGSGKTVGFGLAIAPALLGDGDRFGEAGAPLALVVAPTRELALQVKRELAWLYAEAGVAVASCVGGMDMRDERRALARGAHVVAATPGRLRDHVERGSIDLGSLRAVVLDEADEMLDLGFREDLEFILEQAPADRQTLLFSATVPKSIAGLATRYQRDAERIVVSAKEAQHADIAYTALMVAERDAEKAVINTLLLHDAGGAIVFANTRAVVNRLTTRLANRGFKTVSLSGELSQTERGHALQAMRDGRARVCVATDVAARGIDLPKLDLVIHAELPTGHETLLHRSGRTGRAGRKGVSALIVTPKSRRKAERLLGAAKLEAEWGEAPSADAVAERQVTRMFADETWSAPVEDAERDVVARLVGTFSAEQIAAAFLRLRRASESAPEDVEAVVATPPKPRAAFGPSVWFSITGGRDAGAEPRRLLPMLLKKTALAKGDIGAIRIARDRSYVEVREDGAFRLFDSLGPDREVEPGAVATLMDAPPDGAGARPAEDRPAKGPRGKATGGPRPFKGKPAGKRKPDGPRKPKPHRKGGDR